MAATGKLQPVVFPPPRLLDCERAGYATTSHGAREPQHPHERASAAHAGRAMPRAGGCGRAGMKRVELPLFLLPAVLFPDAELELRVVEPRYLRMLGECARADSGFGVCLVMREERGGAALPAAIGTQARVTDFWTFADGVLGIRVRGGRRFRVATTRVREDGLVRGMVQLWGGEPQRRLAPEFGLLATILERLIEQIGGPWRHADRALFDDAAWVSLRLAELLPLPLAERQRLLEMTDPDRRLADLRDLLPRFQAD